MVTQTEEDPPLISYSGSDLAQDTTNNMSVETAAAPLPVEAPKEEELEVPLPAPIQQDTLDVTPPSAGMGALANAAAGKVDEGVKRSAEPAAEAAPAKKQKIAVAAPLPPPRPMTWEGLMTQVRGQLRAMSSDECFSRALELQMLARAEVGNRSQHLSNAMDLMASGQSTHHHDVVKHDPYKRVLQPLSVSPGQRVTKAEREVSKQKPIKTNKASPVPCMKMTPPLPPRCEIDNAPGIELPAFCQLVNFPTARYYGNCVMCDEAEFAIPKQNKGVCNNCDVAIWVVNPSGMNIKWCKGCKNFRKWIDFGVKGYSSKCERCRQQQATRYANQKNKETQQPPAPVPVPPAPAVPIIPVAAEPAPPAPAEPAPSMESGDV
mmetsp:Transcript_44570/g.93533  ORF Transcript_44570/g.93533 Transcript_44570/m.93533 type:complete len:377 (-) Transcript_44570:226-1356(-)